MTAEITHTELTIKNEIERKCKQRDIAKTYALGLRSTDKIDWYKVNAAIIARWSKSGLERIKKMAWSGSCFEEKACE